MVRYKTLIGILLFFSLGINSVYTQKVLKIDDLLSLILEPGDTLRVFNFWATWCRPCVAELPYFEQAMEDFRSDNVRFYYVSLDFAEELDTKLKPFIKKRKFEGEVMLLDEIDYNSWIDRIDPKWEGSIPATLIVNNIKGFSETFEQSFELEELLSLIKKHL